VALEERVDQQPRDVAAAVIGRHHLRCRDAVGPEVLQQVELPLQRGRRPAGPAHDQSPPAPPGQEHRVAGATGQRPGQFDTGPGSQCLQFGLHLLSIARGSRRRLSGDEVADPFGRAVLRIQGGGPLGQVPQLAAELLELPDAAVEVGGVALQQVADVGAGGPG
jgi:hypothetical protein